MLYQNKNKMTISYRGTEINKIENEWFSLREEMVKNDHEGLFQDDYVYVSNGFKSAVEKGLTPVEIIDIPSYDEWHHIFVKIDSSFESRMCKFN